LSWKHSLFRALKETSLLLSSFFGYFVAPLSPPLAATPPLTPISTSKSRFTSKPAPLMVGICPSAGACCSPFATLSDVVALKPTSLTSLQSDGRMDGESFSFNESAAPFRRHLQRQKKPATTRTETCAQKTCVQAPTWWTVCHDEHQQLTIVHNLPRPRRSQS